MADKKKTPNFSIPFLPAFIPLFISPQWASIHPFILFKQSGAHYLVHSSGLLPDYSCFSRAVHLNYGLYKGLPAFAPTANHIT